MITFERWLLSNGKSAIVAVDGDGTKMVGDTEQNAVRALQSWRAIRDLVNAEYEARIKRLVEAGTMPWADLHYSFINEGHSQ